MIRGRLDGLPVPKLTSTLLVCLWALIISSSAHCSERDPRIYLGPKPGVTLFFRNSSGMLLKVWSKRGATQDTLDIVEKIFFLQNESTKESTSNKKGLRQLISRYSLRIQHGQLVMKIGGKETILMDFSANSWTVPITTFGNVTTTESLATCRVINRENKFLFGQKRNIIKIESISDSPIMGVTSQTWTLISGLGLVSKGDFKLVKLEGQTELEPLEGFYERHPEFKDK